MSEQIKRLRGMVEMLLGEQPQYRNSALANDESELFGLYRSLVNLRPPLEASRTYLALEDAYLQTAISEKGITDTNAFQDQIAWWQGDITTLKADAIVNAANHEMLGCFEPCHSCVDNAIHTYAGVRLRLECADIMARQGHPEPTGKAKITAAYNLPSKHILHTVGPIVTGPLRDEDRRLLASCYRSCLALAERHGLESIAFCCLSTGEFHFPNVDAAEIAVQTVSSYLKSSKHPMKVIFTVFTDRDESIYRERLG